MHLGVAAAELAGGAVVAEPRFSPDGRRLGWLRATDGVTEILVTSADGSGSPRRVEMPEPLGSIGAYRGGVWCWLDDARLVVAGESGRLFVTGVDRGPAVLVTRDARAMAPAADTAGRILFSLGRFDGQDIGEVMVAGRTWPQRLSFADFAWDPATTGDGRRVAWHEWDLDAMSWTSSRILLVDRQDGVPRVVAGGPGVSVGQPRFSPDGRHLAYISDEFGFWNVLVANADGSSPRRLVVEANDHAEPAWGPGQRSFAWSPASDSIAFCRNEDGFARLVVARLDDGAAPVEVAKGWHHGLDWASAGIVAVRSGARTPPMVTIVDPTGGDRRIVDRGAAPGVEDGAREPSVVRWTSDGVEVTGLLYPPDAGSDRPPLLVDVHGGPTGQATVRWDPWLRFFTSRGWAVLRPNPRGSTGSGRAFVQAAARSWGEADVADVAAGIRAAATQGWCDPGRVAIAGGSSGGLVALLVCAHHGDVVRAGVSQYGVTDLRDLLATTHRFESRYLDEVIGVLPGAEAAFRERSPVTHATRIQVPLLMLQGDDDEVVPPEQAQRLVDAVRAAGGVVEHHVYEGEGHGWSRVATITDDLERTLAFLDHWVMS